MNIYEKIHAVMKNVNYLKKDDKVAFGNTKYNAISEEKVTSVIRSELVKQKLVIFPIRQEHFKEGNLTTVNTVYRIVNCESPDEYVEVVSSGTGADSQDKGVGKAMTYAYKYMLLRTFAIPTGEDPDKICSEQIDHEEKKAKQRKKKETAASDDQEIPEASLNEAEPMVTDNMIAVMRRELERIGRDESLLTKLFKVPSLADMTVTQFDKAMKKFKISPSKEQNNE